MMGDRKKIGLFIIILGAAIIGLIVYFLIIKQSYIPSEPAEGVDETVVVDPVEDFPTTNPGNVPINYQTYDVNENGPRETTADDLGKLSMSVAERFGSFSSQSNYGNFTDLKIMMTGSMRSWVDSYVADLRASSEDNSSAYYGITTKAINYQVVSFDEKTGRAEIIVNTQRRESTENINGGEPYNQDLRLELVKVNGEWLFDAAYWSKD